MLILDPAVLVNLFVGSTSFLVDSLGFSTYRNNDSFTFSFSIWMLYISFSCLITLARTSSTMLTSNGEVDFPEAYQFCWPFQRTIFWLHWCSLLFSLLYFIILHSNLYYIFFLLLMLSLVCSSSLDVWVVNLSYLLEIFFNVATTHLYRYSRKAVSR